MTPLSTPNGPRTLAGMSTLGEYIRDRRAQLGMSQTELADRAGLARAHLSEIERGRIAFPNAGIRRDLARALGTTHVVVLIAAGELSPDEVDMPSNPALTFPADDPRADLITLASRLSETDARSLVALATHLLTEREKLLSRTPRGEPNQAAS